MSDRAKIAVPPPCSWIAFWQGCQCDLCLLHADAKEAVHRQHFGAGVMDAPEADDD